MVASENFVGLIVAVSLYFVAMALAVFAAHRSLSRRQKEEDGTVADAMSSHFLGSRKLGVFVTAMSLFASLFSGYTVVGVPEEAFYNGWYALRWLPSSTAVCFGQICTAPRLRKASLLRKHQSPSDFVTDRFRSQLLRYTVVSLQVFPAWVQLAAQCISLNAIFNGMFNLSADNHVPVISISALLVFYEWAGGLASVCYTDVLQGVIMVLAFIALPIVLTVEYGGWPALDFNTYPRPDFYQVLSASQQWRFWTFSAVIPWGAFTLPHMIQRTYAAGSMRALKAGYLVVTLGPWLTMAPGVLAGTLGVWMLRGQPEPDDPMSTITEMMMTTSRLAYVLGLLLFTASLAAIMSSADSVLMGISQLLTAEIFSPICPGIGPRGITWMGRILSLSSMTIALFISLVAKQQIPDLVSIQFGMSLQTVPLYLFGLFAGERQTPHPWVLVLGVWSGFLTCFYVHYVHNANEATSFKHDAGVTAIAVNLASCALGELGLWLYARARVLGLVGSGAGVGLGFGLGSWSAYDEPTAPPSSPESVHPCESPSKQSPSKQILSQSSNAARIPAGSDPRLQRAGSASSQESAERLPWWDAIEQPWWDVPSCARFSKGLLTPSLLRNAMRGIYEPATDGWLVPLYLTLTVLMLPLHGSESMLAPSVNATGESACAARGGTCTPGLMHGMPEWAFKVLAVLLAISSLQLLSISRLTEVESEDDAIDARGAVARELSAPRGAGDLAVVGSNGTASVHVEKASKTEGRCRPRLLPGLRLGMRKRRPKAPLATARHATWDADHSQGNGAPPASPASPSTSSNGVFSQ